MKFLVLLLISLALYQQVLANESPATIKITYAKAYGICATWDAQDLHTNDVAHTLSYNSVALDTTSYYVEFAVNSQFLAVALHNYDHNHHDKSIDVVVQVDQNTPHTKSWNGHVDRQSAFTGNLVPQFQWQQNEQFRRLSKLLNQLAHGQHLYTKVGDHSAIIPFAGARAAVAGFNQQIAYFNMF